MSERAQYYYIGVGVLHHDGKDYGYGKPLPDSVPAATIEALKGKGKVSTTQPAKEGVPVDNALGMLQDKVRQLTADLQDSREETDNASAAAVRAGEEIERLRGQITALQGVVDERDKTIADLTTQLMTPAVPVIPEVPAEVPAGPKGNRK